MAKTDEQDATFLLGKQPEFKGGTIPLYVAAQLVALNNHAINANVSIDTDEMAWFIPPSVSQRPSFTVKMKYNNPNDRLDPVPLGSFTGTYDEFTALMAKIRTQ